jgi:hypothetical protein
MLACTALIGGEMIRRFTVAIVLLLLALSAGPAFSAKIKHSWKNPSATSASLQFKKVLVMAAIQKSFTRKVAEDTIVKFITENGRAQAVPSYTLVGDDEINNQDAIRAKLEGTDFDGVILMRYAGSEDQRKYDEEEDWQGQWNTLYGFWGGAAAAAVYNVTTTNDLTVFIETLFYSVNENQMMWAGICETKNPKSPAKVTAEIAEETAKYLQKQGLIPKK